MMYQTIRVSSCVSVQGEFVELLANGEMVIRDGRNVYRGRPVVGDEALLARALAGGQRASGSHGTA